MNLTNQEHFSSTLLQYYSTWLMAPENMSQTSALKLSGTPLSIRSCVFTVRYMHTPLQDTSQNRISGG